MTEVQGAPLAVDGRTFLVVDDSADQALLVPRAAFIGALPALRARSDVDVPNQRRIAGQWLR
jgi:hypothetical protein